MSEYIFGSAEIASAASVLQVSKPIWSGNEFVLVAEIDDLDLFDDHWDIYKGEGWWRLCSRLNIDVPVHWLGEYGLRKRGLFATCYHHGVSTERNLAAAIGDLAYQLDITPIELFDKLADAGWSRPPVGEDD
jgi:hypothetical protein